LKQYTAHTYGARLPFSDARFLDDFCEQNRMERADVVRLAIKHFVTRQQLKCKRKDPVREMHEEVLREQLTPILEHLQTFSDAVQDAEKGATKNAKSTTLSAEKKLLEQTLMTASLALRILINYALEPTLRPIEATDEAKIQPHLRAAAGGRKHWCEATNRVFDLTELQVSRELNIELEKEFPDATEQGRKAVSDGAETTVDEADIDVILGGARGDKRA